MYALEDAEAACGVCMRNVNDPRILSCLHSFCRGCVEDLVGRSGSGSQEFLCPVCKTATQLTSKGASKLAKDVTRLARAIGCYRCKQNETHTGAEMLCSTCNIHFCKEHGIAHMFANAGHSVTALCDERNPSSLAPRKSTSRPCSEHNLTVRYFCKACDVSVCDDCLALGAHHGHKPVIAIRDIASRRKDAVRTTASKLDTVLLAHVDQSLADVEAVTEALACAAADVRAELESARQRAVGAIESVFKQKVSDVERLEERGREKLKRQQGELEEQCDRLKNAIAFGKKLSELDMLDDDVCEALEVFAERADGLDRLQASLPDMAQTTDSPCVTFSGVEDRRQLVQHAIAMIGVVLAGPYLSDNRTSVRLSTRTSCTSLASQCSREDKSSMKISGLEEAQSQHSTNRAPVPPLQPETSTRNETSESASCQGDPALDGAISSERSMAFSNGQQSSVTRSLSSSSALTFDLSECQQGLVLSRDRKTVTHEATGKARQASVLGSFGMQTGRHSWLVQITKSQSMDIVIGVSKKARVTLQKNNRNMTYSWHGDGKKRNLGKRPGSVATDAAASMSTWQVTDVLQLDLDCNKHVLTMKNIKSGESNSIRNLPDAEMFPYFCLCDPLDTLTLLEYRRTF